MTSDAIPPAQGLGPEAVLSTPASPSSHAHRDLFARHRQASLPVANTVPTSANSASLGGRGTEIGRFLLLDPIGAGGMGMVYAAYDPELDRKVAIKSLLPRTGDSTDASRIRLLREAQALARLTHPNVVTIHDVGTHGARVWIAMEFVSGKTLHAWAKERQRAWPEILRVLTDAARGVAAAHAVGLVHRDLKPENVMIGDDGRVRIMDFGLAHGRLFTADDSGLASTLLLEARTKPAFPALALRMTHSGTVQGTPSYMAPEQWNGHAVGPAADQFGWSVMAWELLYGQRPFDGPAAVVSGQRRPPPRGARVPGWLRRVIERGLSTEPGRRWPSTAVLLSELERRRTGARTRAALITLVSVAAIGAAGESYRRWRVAQEVVACEAEGASLAEVWNEDVRMKLREGLLAAGAANAETTAEKVMPYLEKQAEEWRRSRTETCLDTRVRGEQDQETLDQSVWCLDERRMELEALITEFSRADAASLQQAVSAAAGLSMVNACRDRRRLQQLPQLPQDRERVREVQQTLSTAGALRAGGEYEKGLAMARKALASANEIGWPPLTATALWRTGDLLSESGKYHEAEVELERAYFQAAEAGALEIAADAAASLTWTVGFQQARHVDGIRWARHAFVALSALGADDENLRRAEALDDYASVQQSAGKFLDAKDIYGKSLMIRERMLGPDHPQVAATLNNLATLHNLMGAHGDAKALLERSRAIKEQALGPDHPHVASSLLNLALAHTSIGAHAEAKVLLERARAVVYRTHVDDHPHVADILNSLTVVLTATGAHAEALAVCERALAIRKKALGPNHPTVATSLNNLAHMHFLARSYDEARDLHEQALAIREKTLSPDHPDIATSLNSLAVLHEIAGEFNEARRLHERALAIQENSLGSNHRLVGTTLNNLALVRASLGHYAEAKELYARALANAEQALGTDHPEVATNIYNLANAYHSAKEYDEAKVLHERALAIRERMLGPNHLTIAYSLNSLAKLALVQGRSTDAVSLAERAVRVCEVGDAPTDRLAVVRFTLARALWDAPTGRGRDRSRALVLARQSRDTFRAANNKQLAVVEEFLTKRGDIRH